MNELVKLRYLSMPCCGHQLCWINPRLPNHCPECGSRVFTRLKETPAPSYDVWLRSVPAQSDNDANNEYNFDLSRE